MRVVSGSDAGTASGSVGARAAGGAGDASTVGGGETGAAGSMVMVTSDGASGGAAGRSGASGTATEKSMGASMVTSWVRGARAASMPGRRHNVLPGRGVGELGSSVRGSTGPDRVGLAPLDFVELLVRPAPLDLPTPSLFVAVLAAGDADFVVVPDGRFAVRFDACGTPGSIAAV